MQEFNLEKLFNISLEIQPLEHKETVVEVGFFS